MEKTLFVRAIAVPVAALTLATTGDIWLQAARDPATIQAARSIPTDAEIRRILAERIDDAHQAVGIVVGIVSPKGRRIVTYGVADRKGDRPLDGDTEFEIGSVTKVFTGLLLADMVQRGEVKLDDPIAKYLPAGLTVPSRNGKSITLVDLATHTSGLPRLPTNLEPKDNNDPYADYTAANLDAFLSSYVLTRDPGAQYEYSNLGGGLLGHVLALRAGTDYATLVKRRITDVLGMSSTSVTLAADERARLAPGHDSSLARVPSWNWQVLEGAGALHSTANDLLTFLSANLGDTQTPLAPALAGMLAVTRKSDDGSVGLGWELRTDPAPTIIWHNGGTGGYRTWVGFDPAARVGVVVLSNTFTTAGVDDIGGHLLDSTIAVLTPDDLKPKAHTQVAVDPSLLDRYVGRYEMAPQFILTITKEGSRLFAQATGQDRFEVFPEGEKDFFAKIADIQLTFVVGRAAAQASQVIVHQQGVDTPAPRVR